MKYTTIAALALLAACGTPAQHDPQTAAAIERAKSYAEEVLIPGVQPVDVHGSLEKQGFNVKFSGTEPSLLWECRSEEPGITYVAEVYGRAVEKLSYVRATVITDGITDASLGLPFLGFVASLPYDGADPEQARAWVELHGNTDGAHTEFGGVNFTISAPTNASRMLLIAPSVTR